MNIILKTHGTGETVVIGYNEFKDRIRKGEVFPEDQVQDRVLTNDEWWTVDNLRIFHNLSPIRYAKPSHLVAREKAEEENQRLEEVSQMYRAELEMRARKFFRVEQSGDDYMLSSLFCFLIACNEPPLARHEFAVRFTYWPSFHASLLVRVSRHGGEWKLYYREEGDHPKTGRSLLARDEAQQVFDLAEAVNAIELPSDDNVLGLDGSIWALEIAHRGIYALRYRWSPLLDKNKRRLAEFVALGKYLVELSDLRRSMY